MTRRAVYDGIPTPVLIDDRTPASSLSSRIPQFPMHSTSLLRQLVSFPSVSSTSNLAVSRWVEEQLRQLDFQTEWLPYTDAAGIDKACVIGQIGPPQGRGLAYFCHTDVVPADSWSFPHSEAWTLTEHNDRLYGRGSCDMKGSLAAMLAAAASVGADRLTAPLTIVCTADEEVGMAGARHVAETSSIYKDLTSRQSRGIIGEPTLLKVVHAHKGGRGMRITARGIAAHSSTSEGVNANFAMIPFLHEMHQLCQRIEGDSQWTDDRFDPPTISLNLGINDHTHAVNITPPQSVCTIYFRTMPNIDADALVQEITMAANRHKLELEMMFAGEPMFTQPDAPFIQELVAETATDASATVSYGTDGSWFTDLEDLAVLGPGSIEQAHRDDEWISIDQLQRGEQLYARLIEKYCMPPKGAF